MTTSQTTRSSVLERARNGDWDDFVAIYTELVLTYARSKARSYGLTEADAEDVAQTVLAKIVEDLSRFVRDPDRRGFRAHLMTLVQRRAVDVVRLRKRRSASEGLDDLQVDETQARDEQFDLEWQRAHLRRALAIVRTEVAPHTYQSFELYVLREEPVEKICEFLGLSRNHVYVNKRRVIQRVRELLQELDP